MPRLFIDPTKMDVNDMITALHTMQPGQAMVVSPLPRRVTETGDGRIVHDTVTRLKDSQSAMVFHRHFGGGRYQTEVHACKPRTKQVLEALGDAAYAAALMLHRPPRMHEIRRIPA